MIIGYARVGTDDQRLDSQTDALSAADTNKIFADKIGRSKRVRPELNKMPDQLREGDVVCGATLPVDMRDIEGG